jgi:hypothetical protein
MKSRERKGAKMPDQKIEPRTAEILSWLDTLAQDYYRIGNRHLQRLAEEANKIISKKALEQEGKPENE